MTLPTPAPTTRELARQAWARAATGDATFDLHRASTDAGFRSYWRGATAAGSIIPGGAASGSAAPNSAASTSVIVMDSPPDKEDVRPWLRVRALLEAGGVRVPRVLAQDVEAGFLLLEDLGADTYLHVIGLHNADELLDAAVAQLLKLQAIACPSDLPAYDEALLARELRLFDEWYLGRHLGLSLDCGDLEKLDLVYRQLIDSALAQPQVLVHRDYMPRNLMPVDGGPAVLDFQDAVRGPIAYDPISLFKDAFLSWPEDRVDAWLDRYHARASAAGLPLPSLAQFRRDADLIGVQRHLKVIGIFARLNHRDAKPKYLADVPRFFAYLDGVLPKYPQLAPLVELIEHRVKPAIAEQTRAHEGLA
ncbi:aminoglycoside phosphotransferase family protein [Lysobacter koreensis]|uniref:Aminoglycoside phosphotransferase family protein n=1 Tax=Lysobacter koreensis TaxID=266122 RepID=A0ABW2YRY8_9GAMM